MRRGENLSSRRKTSRSRVENQQTQPTYDAGSGNRTKDTLVEGERSHRCANRAPRMRPTTTRMSVKRKKIFQKGKRYSSLLGKAFQISNNYFYFIGT